MLELIFFYILQKNIQGYDSHFVCARVTVFSGARQQNFAGTGLLCTGATFDLKMRQQIFNAIMRVLPPPMVAAMVADAATITARLPP